VELCTDILLSQVKGGTLYRYFIVTSKRWNFVQIFYCQKWKVELCTDISLSQVKGGTLYRYFIVTSKRWNFVQIFYCHKWKVELCTDILLSQVKGKMIIGSKSFTLNGDQQQLIVTYLFELLQVVFYCVRSVTFSIHKERWGNMEVFCFCPGKLFVKCYL
jgi:hypothetical protein